MGILEKWMADDNLQSFKDMAQCVVGQYSSFQVLSDEFSPNTINGGLTQGENIADNTGLHFINPFFPTVPKMGRY